MQDRGADPLHHHSVVLAVYSPEYRHNIRENTERHPAQTDVEHMLLHMDNMLPAWAHAHGYS